MDNQFWILAAVVIIVSGILLAVDYSNSQKDKKSRIALIWGASIVAAAGLLAAWGYTSINPKLTGSAAMIALVYFGRYLTRKAANRKL